MYVPIVAFYCCPHDGLNLQYVQLLGTLPKKDGETMTLVPAEVPCCDHWQNC